MATTTKLNGIDPTFYDKLVAATDDRTDVINWTLLPGDEDEQADVYWAGRDEGLIDEFDTLTTLYRCDGCGRYFHPADLSVGDGSGDYCWDDGTGNGCRNAHLPEDER